MSVEAGRLSGMEAGAKALLVQAVERDREGRKQAAVTSYTEGIGLLLQVKQLTLEDERKKNLDKRIREYMERAEKLKTEVERGRRAGAYRESYRIPADSEGHDYEEVWGFLVDEEVREVRVEDPYVRVHHQLLNFLRLSEMLVSKKRRGVCPKLASLRLLTGKEDGSAGQGTQQALAFQELEGSLAKEGVRLKVEYSATLHDRQIQLSNGWVVKIGRGLDYFKSSSKYSLGACHLGLRRCHETTVDIFHTSQTADAPQR